MSLGLYENRRRRRRSLWLGSLRWAAAVAFIAGAGFYAYYAGSTLAQRDLNTLQREIEAQRETADALRRENSELIETVRAANERADEFERRLAGQALTSADQQVLDVARRRIEEGVAPARLAAALADVGGDEVCDANLLTKRFIVQTPLYSGANDTVSFADNALIVTASGASSLSDAGAPEAWFDPAQPVAVRFMRPGGAVSEAAGKLPLHHLVQVDKAEYRFTLQAGARGFINVTSQTCRYR